LVAFAVAAVIALVFAVQQTSPAGRPRAFAGFPPPAAGPKEEQPAEGPRADGRQPRADAGTPPAEKADRPAPDRRAPFVFDDDHTLADLRKAAEGGRPGGTLEVVLKRDLDLSRKGAGDPAGLVFGRRLGTVLLRGEEGRPRPTIRLTYDDGPPPPFWTALSFP